MATGAYDDQGVWRYGEDDPAYPLSALLNRGMVSVSDELEDDRDRLNLIEASLAPVAWTKATSGMFTAPWAQITTSPWDGVWYCRRAGVVTIAGAISSAPSSPVVGQTILTMPVGLRPGKPVAAFCTGTTQIAMLASGVLQVLVVGGATFAFTTSYPIA